MAEERKKYEQRFNALKEDANTWIPSWTEIRDNIAPRRGIFSGSNPNDGALINHRKLIDDTPQKDLGILASGMSSGLTSPSRPWFKLTLEDQELMDIEAVRNWLATAEEMIYGIFAKSNIYEMFYNIYEELGAFATGAAALVEDFKTVVRAQNYTIGEYYLGFGSDGRLNSFAREESMTAEQMVQEFGEENVSAKVRDAVRENKLTARFIVRHIIEPNTDRAMDKVDFGNMPFRSVYWEASGTEGILQKRGFEDFPIVGPRWGVTRSCDSYGSASPGWNALGNAKMLQKLHSKKLLGVEKSIDPPMQVDATVSGQVNTLPGGLTHFSGTLPNAGLKPAYLVNPNIPAINETIEDTRHQLDASFYTDMFLMMSRDDRSNVTAREVIERHEEKLLLLGPILVKLQSELHNPVITRTFNVAMRNNLLPPPPLELQGRDIKIEYVSILAQAQKMLTTSPIEDTVSFAGSLAGAFPEVLDNVDSDAALRIVAEAKGANPKILRSKDAVASIRQARQKAQQAQAQAQDAAAAVAGAETLSKTQMGKGNALDALIGSMPVQGQA